MKKYAKLSLAMAAVVLFIAGEAWAVGPQGRGKAAGSTAKRSPAASGAAQSATGNSAVKSHKSGLPTGSYQLNQGTATGPLSGNPAAQSNTTRFQRNLGLSAGAGAAIAARHMPHQWQQQATWIRNHSQGRYNNLFTPQWYAHHPNAWHAMHPRADVWAVVAWPALANWLGVTGGYAPYSYGSIYESNTYYIDEAGMPVGEETDEAVIEEYPEDPAELASQGQTDQKTANDPSQWMPLGVFAITSPETKSTPDRLFQFAVNKNGQIAGSYYDVLSGQTMPVQGAVNKTTRRAAWTIGSNKTTVMETSLGGFVENQATVTVHSSKGDTTQWMMVRLENPTANSPTTPTSPQGNTNSQGNVNPQSNTNQNPVAPQGTN